MMGVTGRQKDALDFITSYIDINGKSPTLSEISDGIGLRTKARCHAILIALKERGRITWIPYHARSYMIVEEHTYRLPSALHLRFQVFCEAHGESPADVLADAVTLHLDALGG